MAKISIIVPVYNAKNYIEACIKSVLEQTYSDFELLLINDGSTDGSGDILEKFAKMDKRVKVYNRANHGVSASRNFGISNAVGEYIMFLDADDTINADTLKDNIEIIISNDADVVISGFYYHVIDENVSKENPLPEYFVGTCEEFFNKWYVKVLNQEAINPPWNKLIKKCVIDSNQIEFNEKFSICEDMAFSMDILLNSAKVVLNDKIYYNYYVKSQGSLVFKFYINYFEALTNYYKKAVAFCNKYKNNMEQRKAVDTVYANLMIMYIKLVSKNKDLGSKEKKELLVKIFNDEGFLKAADNATLNKKKTIIHRQIVHKRYKTVKFLYSMMK